ncbi:GNAT family N-acetyltransferase [Fusibacter bizertensis]
MNDFKIDQLCIVRPQNKDVAAIEVLFERVLEDNWEKNGLWDLESDLQEEIELKKSFLAMDLSTQGKEKYFLIAKVDGRVVGTIEIGKANETIETCGSEFINELPEIGTVFVLPEFQGRGIGSFMMEAMCQYLKKESYKGFFIDSGYKTAQEIWIHKYGEPTFLLKDHWGPGLDHMVWQILF